MAEYDPRKTNSDGSYDRAFDDLLRAAAEYLEVGTAGFRDSLEEAIRAARKAWVERNGPSADLTGKRAAVEKAKKERGK